MSLPVEQSFRFEFDTKEGDFLASIGMLDEAEELIAQLPQHEPETIHEFLPSGFYVRTFIMPKGLLLTSKIHYTEHPFIMSYGDLRIWTEKGTTHLRGYNTGITRPYTKRLAYVLEETKWSTFHQGEWKTVEEVEADIILPHVNPRLTIPYADANNKPATHHLDGTPVNHDYVLHNE